MCNTIDWALTMIISPDLNGSSSGFDDSKSYIARYSI